MECKVPDGASGEWRVETFEVSEHDASFFNLRQAIHGHNRPIIAGKYKRLVRGDVFGGDIVMSNTPAEIEDMQQAVKDARGKVLVNGLGLGLFVSAILEKKEVQHVKVVEISEDVIKLVADTVRCDKCEVVKGDAFTYRHRKRYDYVWHDIWDNITSDNLKEMARLNNKFTVKHLAAKQGFWCKKECQMVLKYGARF